ncbi:hypothetical protein DIPPA_51855, partial [Diplonema papillatum]
MPKSRKAASVASSRLGTVASHAPSALSAGGEQAVAREVVETFQDGLSDVRCAAYVYGRVWLSTKSGQITVRDPRSRVLAMIDETERCGYPHCLTLIGPHVWVGYSSGIIKVYHTHTVKETPGGEFKRHSGAVHAIAFKGAKVFSGSGDFLINEWTRAFVLVRQLSGHAGGVRCLYCKGGLLLSGSDDGTVRVWSVDSQEAIKRLHAHQKGTRVIQVHRDYIWTGGEDGVIQVWDGGTYELVVSLEEHAGPVTCMIPVEAELWTGSTDRTICVWCGDTFALLKRFPEHTSFVTCLVKVVAQREVSEVWSGGADKKINVWGWTAPVDSDECQRLRDDLATVQDSFKEQQAALCLRYRDMEAAKDAHIAELNRAVEQQAEDLLHCTAVKADLQRILLEKEGDLVDAAAEQWADQRRAYEEELARLRRASRKPAAPPAHDQHSDHVLVQEQQKVAALRRQLNDSDAALDALRDETSSQLAEAFALNRAGQAEADELRNLLDSKEQRITQQRQEIHRVNDARVHAEEARIEATAKTGRLQSKCNIAESRVAELEDEVDMLQKRLREADVQRDNSLKTYASQYDGRSDGDKGRERIAELVELNAGLTSRLRQLQDDNDRLNRVVRRLDADREEQASELNESAKRAALSRAAADGLEGRVLSLEGELGAVKAERETLLRQWQREVAGWRVPDKFRAILAEQGELKDFVTGLLRAAQPQAPGTDSTFTTTQLIVEVSQLRAMHKDTVEKLRRTEEHRDSLLQPSNPRRSRPRRRHGDSGTGTAGNPADYISSVSPSSSSGDGGSAEGAAAAGAGPARRRTLEGGAGLRERGGAFDDVSGPGAESALRRRLEASAESNLRERDHVSDPGAESSLRRKLEASAESNLRERAFEARADHASNPDVEFALRRKLELSAEGSLRERIGALETALLAAERERDAARADAAQQQTAAAAAAAMTA